MTRDTADPVMLLAGLGPQGRFDTGHTIVADLASELSAIKEAHHLYPVLFFYRPYQPANSIPQLAFIALDDGQYRWLKESAAVESLGRLASLMVETLGSTFIPGVAPDNHENPQQASHHDGWCTRYRAALRQLERAGICVRPDQDEGARQYSRMRQEWHPYVEHLARYMDYDMAVIDPATASAIKTCLP